MTEQSETPELPAEKPAKAKVEKVKSEKDRTNARWVAAGAAMGIGSAALVAALLYTNRDKKEVKPPKPPKHAPESD
jgi:formate/nitrite transporter FocA (FNT family)